MWHFLLDCDETSNALSIEFFFFVAELSILNICSINSSISIDPLICSQTFVVQLYFHVLCHLCLQELPFDEETLSGIELLWHLAYCIIVVALVPSLCNSFFLLCILGYRRWPMWKMCSQSTKRCCCLCISWLCRRIFKRIGPVWPLHHVLYVPPRFICRSVAARKNSSHTGCLPLNTAFCWWLFGWIFSPVHFSAGDTQWPPYLLLQEWCKAFYRNFSWAEYRCPSIDKVQLRRV